MYQGHPVGEWSQRRKGSHAHLFCGPLVIVHPSAEQPVEINQRDSVVAGKAMVVQPMEVATSSGILVSIVASNGCNIGMELQPARGVKHALKS